MATEAKPAIKSNGRVHNRLAERYFFAAMAVLILATVFLGFAKTYFLAGMSRAALPRGWGCSECSWVFHPSDPPIGKSLDEMKRNFQMQLSHEFESHDCPEYPRTH